MVRMTVKDLNIKVDEIFGRLDSKIDELKKEKRNFVSTADPSLANKVAGIEREIKGLTARLNVQTRTVSKLRTIIDEMQTPVGENVPTVIPWRTRVWTNVKNKAEKIRNR